MGRNLDRCDIRVGSSRIECQGIDEGLEHGTRLAGRARHVQRAVNRLVEVIRAANESQDLSIVWIEGDKRGIIDVVADSGSFVFECLYTALQCAFGEMLVIQVQCGAYDQTLA